MKATLLDSMGSDLTVVNAARVSFSKRHFEFDNSKDVGLIRYLAENNHWTPFGHCAATFHVKAPIFVARQLVKHQVGLVWNEVSRRYVDNEPEFWWPDHATGWRKRAENKKQGSLDEAVTLDDIGPACESFQQHTTALYKRLLDTKIAPELARIVLPVNLYTEWHWTGSLMAFARVCRLRLDQHAQAETRVIAKDIYTALMEKFPVSFAALTKDVSV